jgi:WhiB family redox-sensing transcriptional regulator
MLRENATIAAARPVVAPPRWDGTAACAQLNLNPELFFPVDEDGDQAASAKAVCAGCQVRQQCLDYALAAGVPVGVWGGLSTTERDALIRPAHQPARGSGR